MTSSPAKTLLAAAAAWTALALPAGAEIIFVGTGAITAASTACGTAATAGDFGRMTYRPAYPGFGNGANSYLSYVPSRASYAMSVANNTFRASINYSGQSVGSTLNVASKAGGVTAWAQTPVTPAVNSRTLTFTATLANFWAITGCTVSLRANLLRVKSSPSDIVN